MKWNKSVVCKVCHVKDSVCASFNVFIGASTYA